MKPQLQQMIREELLRSIAWIGLGIVGWPILISEVAWLDTTALTVFGLPVLTWMVLTTGMISIRVATSRELQVQTPVGLSISLPFGIMLGGVTAVYLAPAVGYSALWIITASVTVPGLTTTCYYILGFRTGDHPMST